MRKILFLFVLTSFILSPRFSFSQELARSASFGAQVMDLKDSLKTALKLTSLQGTHIKKVVEGSAANQAGFLVNDVLVSMDEEPIDNTNKFLALLKKHAGGDKIKIGFYRDAKLKNVIVTLAPKPMETSSEFEIIYSSVKSGSNNLRTIITKPKSGSKFPAVLIVGGVGCYSIDNPVQIEIQSMKLWADSLAKNGFVSMRVEKTGMGDSKGIPCTECDFNTEKQGYLDALKQLKSLSYVDKENVFIAGFSIGGIVGPLIAQQEPVKGIIVYGTVGRNWLEYEIDNSFRQQMLDDTRADSLDRFMRADYIRLYCLFVEKKQPEQVMKEHPETRGHLFRYPMRIEYFQQVADINIREMWMKTTAKVLAIHGSSDFVSSADEHELIGEIVNQYHPGNGSYLEIANCDHWDLTTENEKTSAMRQHTGLNPMPMRFSINWMKDLL